MFPPEGLNLRVAVIRSLWYPIGLPLFVSPNRLIPFIGFERNDLDI